MIDTSTNTIDAQTDVYATPTEPNVCIACTIEHQVFHLIEFEAIARWHDLYEADPHFFGDAIRDVEADTLRAVIEMHRKAFEDAWMHLDVPMVDFDDDPSVDAAPVPSSAEEADRKSREWNGVPRLMRNLNGELPKDDRP
jgi:hypothetical protein